ncbi:DNA polymerase II small subunit [uncultured archaeon]|nr:DNA polymerase II small subunit [uncultured archaeon]
METKEVLAYCLKKGLLVDKEVLSLFSETQDFESAKLIIEKVRESNPTSKILTKHILLENREQVNQILEILPAQYRQDFEKLRINLGLSIEICKEVSSTAVSTSPEEVSSVRVLSNFEPVSKKLTVSDFVGYFKGRFVELRNILQEHSELTNLVSINKISNDRQGISIIGLIADKKVTKNKNLMLEVEDLTGKIKVLINKDKKELYAKAEDLALDSVVGFKGAGSREIFFVNEVILPEASLPERKRSPVEEYAVFIGDMHIGSKLFMEEQFLKFIEYLNGKVPNTPEVQKIKYLFVIGDVITGVGNYPNQEKQICLPDLESHFEKAAELLGKIRPDIKIIISSGNHDGVRLMEPQPMISEKYAWPLYNLKNVIFTTNPSLVNFAAKKGFSGFNALTYHGFSFFHYVDNIPSLIKQKAAHAPELVMTYLLKNRHLCPTHSSTQYFPQEKDSHIIRTVPDIFLAGHTHKSGITYYNNILVISVSSWESMTAYQEKRGAIPDFCKVPILNLKTGAIKILDFEQ